jgi:hypothetical protein
LRKETICFYLHTFELGRRTQSDGLGGGLEVKDIFGGEGQGVVGVYL